MKNWVQISLQIPTTENGPAYGGAMLAMVGCGEYKSVNECCEKFVTIQKTLSPDKQLSEKYQKRYDVFKSIYPQMKSLFKQMAWN